MRYFLIFWCLAPLLLSACGNSMNCAVHGDNVRGHVIYTSTGNIDPSKSIRIQYSTNSFSSVTDVKEISNSQGLIAVPFTYCADSNVNVSFRAYVSTTGAAFASGDLNGREDGNPNGHSTYLTHNFPTPSPSVTWKVDRDVNIWLDDTSSQ